MEQIGIKLADGSFFPILKEGAQGKKELKLTTVKDGQSVVRVPLYKSKTSSINDAEYIDTLEIVDLKNHESGEVSINLDASIDDEGKFSANLVDLESGKKSKTATHSFLKTEHSKGLLNKAKKIAEKDFASETPFLNTTQDIEENAQDFSTPPAQIDDAKKTTDAEPLLKPAQNENEKDDLENGVSLFEESSALPDFDFENDFAFNENAEKNEEPVEDNFVSDVDANLEKESDFGFSPDEHKSTIQQAFGPAQEKLDFSDVDFNMPDFSDVNFLSNEKEAQPVSEDFFSDSFFDENENEGENEKKQKRLVAVCIVCAAICVFAALSIFFVIPSKLNLFSAFDKDEQNQTSEIPIQTSELQNTEIQKKDEAPVAKEDEIVIVTQADLVVPDLPTQDEKKEKKVISYKIKWGDTLWDLCATYYKNPWLYPKLARYNNLKNPNHIISGTYINIPEEF